MQTKTTHDRRRRKRRPSVRLLELRSEAKKKGWLKWIRQGLGEEADERAMMAGCYFSQHRADHWFRFAERFGTLTEGPWAGKPFQLIDWQYWCSGRVFGWMRPSREWGYPVRRFRFWYEEVPKKNGKTPFLSLIGNYLLFADSYGRQINLTTAATTRKQAERLVKHAVRQIANRKELATAATIRKLEGFLHVQYANNEWNVVAADPDSADGVNGHCLADELHRWKGHEFFNTLRWMLATQPEGLFCGITTAGSNMDSVCRALHEKTKRINTGQETDEGFFGEIFAADPDDDLDDPEVWKKANPSLGDTADAPLKMSAFRADYEAARRDPSEWAAFKQLRLGLWRSNTDGWLDHACPRGFADWDSGSGEREDDEHDGRRIDCYEPYAEEDLHDSECVLGFDGATVLDTTSAVLSFVDPEEPGIVRTLSRFWMPENTAIRYAELAPYREWSERGFIRLTPGDAVDFDWIYRDLCDWLGRFRVRRIYFDPLFQAEWLTQKLEAAIGAERVGFKQTIMNFAPVIRTAERLIVRHDLRHNGHPVLSWQMSNAAAYTNPNGDKRLVKPPDGDHKKIDGAVAMLMSITDVVTGDEGQVDFYEENDVEWI